MKVSHLPIITVLAAHVWRETDGMGISGRMPLSCRDEGRTLYAFHHDPAAWTALIADNRRRRHLRAPCCEAGVALKTSRLGTRFFAHRARGGCTTADESAEHVALKAQAVAAAEARGWTAATEVAGATPDGQHWRADVLATRGRHRVAVEVQWSPQTDAETLRRQAQYAASGVRCLWLFRQAQFPASEDVPAVRVVRFAAGELRALGQPVVEVLDAAFDRRLIYGFPAGRTARVTVHGVAMPCWHDRCGAISRPLHSVAVSLGDNDVQLGLLSLGRNPSIFRAIMQRLPDDPARGIIKPRYSKTTNSTELANGCFRCDRLLGNFFVETAFDSQFTIASFDIVIDADWHRALADKASGWTVVVPARPRG